MSEMNKQVLSIEQMKELTDLGISDANASMMFITYRNPNPNFASYSPTLTRLVPKHGMFAGVDDDEYIPTFTLHDVLEMLPKDIYVCSGKHIVLDFDTNGNFQYSWCTFGELDATAHYCKNGTSLIDSAFEMLKWVKQNNYIKIKDED